MVVTTLTDPVTVVTDRGDVHVENPVTSGFPQVTGVAAQRYRTDRERERDRVREMDGRMHEWIKTMGERIGGQIDK